MTVVVGTATAVEIQQSQGQLEAILSGAVPYVQPGILS
jgi:hypothetical protein